jgi:hypothetical protein
MDPQQQQFYYHKAGQASNYVRYSAKVICMYVCIYR